MSDSSAPIKRLKALESSEDGFQLAELDLKLRGPGVYGHLQHGHDLEIANFSDHLLIASARQAAQDFTDRGEDLLHYKELAGHITRLRAVTSLN